MYLWFDEVTCVPVIEPRGVLLILPFSSYLLLSLVLLHEKANYLQFKH